MYCSIDILQRMRNMNAAVHQSLTVKCVYFVHGSKQMKKRRLAAGALALAVSVTACGCGEQIYEMTKEEEAVIVHYAAHAVSKFNKKQPEGIEDVTALKALMEEEAEQKEREKEKKRQEKEEKKAAEDKKQAESPSSDSKSGQDGQQKKYVSLSRALGLGKIKAVYRRYETAAAYQASQSYMIRADSGNELLVLHVNLRNDTDETVKCDILSKMPVFRLTAGGELSVTADTTILLNDLGTYQGSIQAGKKAGTVLIFQVKKGAVKSSDSLELEVTAGGKSSLVQLTG